MNLAAAKQLLDVVLDVVREHLNASDARHAALALEVSQLRTQQAELLKECADNANRCVRVSQHIKDLADQVTRLADGGAIDAERIADLSARVDSLTACMASVAIETKRKSARPARTAPN